MNNSCGAQCALPNSPPGSYKEILVPSNGKAAAAPAPSNNGTTAAPAASTPATQTTTQALTSQAELDRLAEQQREKTAELSRLIDQISEAIMKSKAVAGIAPSEPRERPNADRAIEHEITVGNLAARRLHNGDVAYTIPGDTIRTAGGILGTPEAFVERGLRTKSPYLEITGASDRQLAAAMAHAARRWEGDDVVIHAEGRHEARVIRHAVAAGLNIVNDDARVQKLVTAERERQANSRPGFKHEERAALIERVSSRGNPSEYERLQAQAARGR
jgi:hypothetical protein